VRSAAKSRSQRIHVDLPEEIRQGLCDRATAQNTTVEILIERVLADAVGGENGRPAFSRGTRPAHFRLPSAYAEEVHEALPGYEDIGRVGRRARGDGSSSARADLRRRYAEKLIVNPALSRALVSFQSNKTTPFYRWFKYKEAFSHEFVRYVLGLLEVPSHEVPRVLDPFAGAGTTLTTATKEGWHATGIELLPVGTAAMQARLLADSVSLGAFDEELARLESQPLRASASAGYRFPHLRITAQAFPPATEKAIGVYQEFLREMVDQRVRYLFWFASLAVLEEVSYTRKDGQYLRWDARSGRNLRSSFDKGPVSEFGPALLRRLHLMRQDLVQRNGGTFSHSVQIIEGSCLDELPGLADETFDLVLTSPPYCNRYDYTRTYALELAFLNYGERALASLRQLLLSATVENKTKRLILEAAYARRGQAERYQRAEAAFRRQEALAEVLALLYAARERGELNNSHIPTMVENYFFEMNLVIHELGRILVPGGLVVMVNDNVQYHGEEVPVDLILSDFAEAAGLHVREIWVLSRGKGNSSQQMGVHGRNELRKCVYVWEKPESAATPQ